MNVQTLSLQTIADKCNEHTKLFYANKPYNPAFCFELLRRALRLLDSAAFAHVYKIYFPQVLRWVYQHSHASLTNQPAEDFAQTAIMQFYFNLRGASFERFSSLDAILQYLKACVHSAIWDFLKKHPPSSMLEDIDMAQLPAEISSLEHNIDRDTILKCVAQTLNDDELIDQFRLWIIYGMKPADIVAAFPDQWQDPRDITVLRQKIKRRLRGDENLPRCLEGYLIPA